MTAAPDFWGRFCEANRFLLTAIPLIVTPTALEFRAVRKALSPLVEKGVLRVARCGAGPGRAGSFCRGLDPAKISSLCLVGWAGGLQARAEAGAVVCAEAALMAGRPAIPCETAAGDGWLAGPILTVSKALLAPEEKTAAASSGALAVEMEAYPLAEWALDHRKPFYHSRVVLDSRDESLPGLVRDPARGFAIRLAQNLAGLPRLVRRIREVNARMGVLAAGLARQVCSPPGS